MKKFAITAVCLTLATHALRAQSTGVSFDSGSKQVFNQNTGASIPLSGGTSADGDGFVLQLGYYSNATINNWFAGTWIPLTGEGSSNTAAIVGASPAETYNRTSIGDLNGNGAGDGTFALSLVFTPGDPMSGNNLPPSNTIPLSIRFYNAATLAESNFYNAVSSNSWLWQTPSTPPAAVTLSLDDALSWYSIVVGGQAPASAFHTTVEFVAVPEPSTYALFILAVAGAIFARRRLKAAA